MKRPGEPRGIYKALTIERIDLVDRGASFDPATGEGAHVTIIKRADDPWVADVSKSVLSARTRNKLPASSFAVVDSAGNGHLPYKHADGSIDLPHLRNALARLDQTKISPEEKAKAKRKLEAAARTHLSSHAEKTMADDTTGPEDEMDEDEQEAKAKAKKAAAKKTAETQSAEVKKAVADAVAAEVTKREALEAMVTKMRDEQERATYVTKAAGYPAFGAKEAFGEILHVCAKALTKEQFTHLTDRLGAVSNALAESTIMKELGGAEQGDESPDAVIEKMAVEIRKSNPKLTREQAYAEALATPEGSAIYTTWKKGA